MLRPRTTANLDSSSAAVKTMGPVALPQSRSRHSDWHAVSKAGFCANPTEAQASGVARLKTGRRRNERAAGRVASMTSYARIPCGRAVTLAAGGCSDKGKCSPATHAAVWLLHPRRINDEGDLHMNSDWLAIAAVGGLIVAWLVAAPKLGGG